MEIVSIVVGSALSAGKIQFFLVGDKERDGEKTVEKYWKGGKEKT